MSLFLIVTHGTAGDILQLVRLGRGLRERGHEVVLLSHSPYAGPAQRAGIDFVALDDELGYQRHLASTPDLLDLRSPADLRAFYERTGMLELLQLEVETMIARHRPGDTVLLGRYGSALSMPIAAELLGAPAAWVALYPSQLMITVAAEYYIEAGLSSELDAVRAAVGLPPVTDWPGWLRSPELTLALWPRWFDESGARAPDGATVTGFVVGDEDDDSTVPAHVADLLDRQPPPVLVTGGTGRMLHPDFYPVAVGAAAATGRTTVVVTPHQDLVPRPLPHNVTWVARLPFRDVFPRLGAVVHHGGIGTSMRALRAGTSQVIVADGLDRPDNASRLATHDLALWSAPPQWTVAAVSAQLEQALEDAGYPARAAARLAGDDTQASVGAAATALEELLSSRRPAGTAEGHAP